MSISPSNVKSAMFSFSLKKIQSLLGDAAFDGFCEPRPVSGGKRKAQEQDALWKVAMIIHLSLSTQAEVFSMSVFERQT